MNQINSKKASPFKSASIRTQATDV